MSKLTVIIPTYRRTERQLTFKGIPKRWKKRTVFVLDKKDARVLEEKYGHTGAEFLVHPKEIDSIAKKRVWILKQKRFDKILMLDDDLRFAMRRQERLVKCDKENVGYAFQLIENKLDELAHCGLSARQGNISLKGGWNRNKRMMYALGYRAPVIREKCVLGRVEIREDIELALQLITQGFDNAVLADYCVDQGAGYGRTEGGTEGQRNVEQSNRDAVKLQKLYPRIVEIVDKEYKSSIARKEVIVSWRQAGSSKAWAKKWGV